MSNKTKKEKEQSTGELLEIYRSVNMKEENMAKSMLSVVEDDVIDLDKVLDAIYGKHSIKILFKGNVLECFVDKCDIRYSQIKRNDFSINISFVENSPLI